MAVEKQGVEPARATVPVTVPPETRDRIASAAPRSPPPSSLLLRFFFLFFFIFFFNIVPLVVFCDRCAWPWRRRGLASTGHFGTVGLVIARLRRVNSAMSERECIALSTTQKQTVFGRHNDE